MKHLSTIALALFFVNATIAQSIKNTTWKTVNSTSGDTITVEILTDTVNQYLGKDSLLVSSLFEQFQDTVSLLDVAGPYKCPNPDTGWYNFNLVGDTMTIHLIADPCVNRAITIDNKVLWRVDKPTGIANINSQEEFLNVYPNPSEGRVYISTEFSGNVRIYTTSGQMIWQQQLVGGSRILSPDLKKGFYIVAFENATITRQIKLVIKNN